MRAQLQLQGRGWLQASLVEYVYARALMCTLEFRPAPSRTRNRYRYSMVPVYTIPVPAAVCKRAR